MARTSRKGGSAVALAAPVEKVWNTALYARLSIQDNGRKGADTIETQTQLVSSYAKERSYLEIYDTYIDNGSSGVNFDRPAWNRLMDDIRQSKVNCVVVKDLSRFGRNYIETCEMLEKVFPFMGVRFISVNDGFDSEHDGGSSESLIIALKSLVNDQYSRDISRKVSSVKKAMRERGEYAGAFAPFGYRKSKEIKNKLEPDEETAPIVRDIFRWRSEGMGQAAICKRLDELGVPCPSVLNRQRSGTSSGDYNKAFVWQPKAVKQMIRSRVYLGHLEQGKTRQSLCEHYPHGIVPESDWHITENAHEAIVSAGLWEAANAMEQARRKKFYEDRNFTELPENIFRGFLVCGVCGSKLVRKHSVRVNPSGKHYEYFHYYCNLQRQHPEDRRYPMVRYETIYDLVFPLIAGKLELAEDLGAMIEKRAKSRQNPRAALDTEISRCTMELEALNERLAGMYEDYADKLLSEHEYVQIKGKYEHKAELLCARMDDLSRRAAIMADVFRSDNRWLKAAEAFLNPTELTREMLETIATKIEINGSESISIMWKFKDEFEILKECAGADVHHG